jgi:hypothetical protein
LPNAAKSYERIFIKTNRSKSGIMKKVLWIKPIIFTVVVLFLATGCKKEEPESLTQPATNLSITGATLNGTVNPNGVSTTVTFEYGATTSYDTTVTAIQSIVTGNSITNVSADISGLTIGTTYHFRVKAENSFGTVYGSDTEFEFGYPPFVTALEATNLTSTTAILNGTVNARGFSTVITFEYGTTESYGQEVTPEQNIVTGNSITNVSADISGLNLCAIYHFRVKAENFFETVYSSDTEFNCGPPPIVTTLEATTLTSNTATLNGIVSANSLSAYVTFEYGTTASYGQVVTPETSPVTGNTDTNVSATLKGITCGTKYHFRVKAENTCGTSYGSDIVFQCGPPPLVETLGVTTLTQNTATLNGIVNANFFPANVTFEYGTTTSYGHEVTAEQNPVTGNDINNVNADISGLTPCTTYHFRVKAENSCGTNYGSDATFYPPNSVLPVLTTTSISGITSTSAISGGNITSDWCPYIPITDRGVEWMKIGIGGRIPWFRKTHDGTGTGSYTSNLTGLQPNTSYQVRSYAVNSTGKIYGNIISFKTTGSGK